MEKQRIYTSLGMMSGTSLDGIDISVLKTDGQDQVDVLSQYDFFFPYPAEVKEAVRAVFGKKDIKDAEVMNASALVTKAYCDALDAFFAEHDLSAEDIDLLGVHGQTITHLPDEKLTIQIGDAQKIADHIDTPTVADLRQNDIMNGGQGAPLLPIYHSALAQKSGIFERHETIGLLNIGGVSNITVMSNKDDAQRDLIAFDTGPGNAYMDDLVSSRLGLNMDEDGVLARRGTYCEDVVTAFMLNEYFGKPYPKSLDRGDFEWLIEAVEAMSDIDALATLLECTVRAISLGVAKLPLKPEMIYLCGGGANNVFLRERLSKLLGKGIKLERFKMDDVDSDFIEAQGFAYLAVRAVLGLPVTFSGTTGVSAPLSGGEIYIPLSQMDRVDDIKKDIVVSNA